MGFEVSFAVITLEDEGREYKRDLIFFSITVVSDFFSAVDISMFIKVDLQGNFNGFSYFELAFKKQLFATDRYRE